MLLALWILVGCEPVDAPAPTSGSEAVPSGGQSTASTPRPRRIILVSLDTAGARHFGGDADTKIPTLEAIAADGVRFERFYSASTYTLPSHMSMFTGLSPLEHGVVNNPSRLAPDVPTIASALHAAGYATRGVVEKGFVDPRYGFDQGFDEYIVRNVNDVVGLSIWSTLDWMRTQGDHPYFLFLHTYAPHSPYRGYRDYRRTHPELDLPDDAEIEALKAQYNKTDHNSFFPASREIPDELRHFCTFYNTMSDSPADFLGCGDRVILDDFLEDPKFEAYKEGFLEGHRGQIAVADRMLLGHVRDLLIELGQWEDTLFVVTSDHGDAIFEHSVHGHDYTPYNEVVKIPLYLSYPRRVPAGRVVHGLTWHLDLLPTILSLAGVPVPSGLHGRDLTPVILGEAEIPADRAIHPVLLRPTNRYPMPMRRMVIRGDYKYIEGHPAYGDPKGMLFDLKTSPGETENLRETKKETFSELEAISREYDASLELGHPRHQETGEEISPLPGEVEPWDAPEDVKQGLEALGYLFDHDEAQGAGAPASGGN